MPLTSRSFTDFTIPDEIVTSGDYQSAQNLLGKESAPSEILAERFYRLTGRRLFDHLKEEKLDVLVNGGFMTQSRSKLKLTKSGLRRLNSIAKALLV